MPYMLFSAYAFHARRHFARSPLIVLDHRSIFVILYLYLIPSYQSISLYLSNRLTHVDISVILVLLCLTEFDKAFRHGYSVPLRSYSFTLLYTTAEYIPTQSFQPSTAKYSSC